MALHKEYRLPLPPGKFRTMDFHQVFKNETAESVVIRGHKDSAELKPQEEIDIYWDQEHWIIKPKVIQ